MGICNSTQRQCSYFRNDNYIESEKLNKNIKKSSEFLETIMIQQNCICKIVNCDSNEVNGTGFLSLIPYPDKSITLPVLITCNHIINRDTKKVKLFLNDKIEKILVLDNTRKIYVNDEKDIIIIEIKKEDKLKYKNILKIDYDILKNKNLNDIFKSIYILYFPFGKEVILSMGSIENIKDDIIKYKCETEKGSSGAPIINLNSYNVIGIHKETNNNLSLNIGILLKDSIKNFFKFNKNKNKKRIYFLGSGDRYKGCRKNNKMEGKGIYYFGNGDKYEGDFKNNNMEGKGKYYYNNGDKYEGDFKNDKMDGKGIYYFKSGSRYEGNFKNDKKEGKGIYYYNDGDKFEGYFKMDESEGKGIYYYNNGDRYEGNYKNDKRQGKGIYYYSDGKTEICNFLNGKEIKKI